MLLDAAVEAQTSKPALPSPQRFAALFEGFEHPQTGWTLAVHEADTYRGLERDDDGHRSVTGVRCSLKVLNRAGRQVGTVNRRCWADSEGRLVVRHSNISVDEPGRGFGSALTEHSLDRYRELGVDRVQVGAVGLGSWAWSKFGFSFSGRGAGHEQARADRRRASAIAGQVPLGRARDRLAEMADQGVLPAQEARRYMDRLPTLEQAQSGNLDGMICTPAELRELGRDGTRFAYRAEMRNVTVDDDACWAGRRILLSLQWEGTLQL
jgi:hypothetical protein